MSQDRDSVGKDIELNASLSSSPSSSGAVSVSPSSLHGPMWFMLSIGIPTHTDTPSPSPSSLCRLTTIIEYTQWLLCISMSVYFVIHSVLSSTLVWSIMGALIWVLHSCCQYSIMKHSMINGNNLIDIMYELSQPAKYSWRDMEPDSNTDAKRAECQSQLIRRANAWAYTCMFLSVFNTTVAAMTYSNNFLYRLLPLTNHVVWNVFGICAWYLYSFGWFAPLLFVSMPAYFLTLRVNRFGDYIERQHDDIDVGKAMEWYDDLYEMNRTLQRAIGPMATCTLATCIPLQIVEMMGFFLQEGSPTALFTILAWCSVNASVLYIVSSSLAGLEVINKRILICVAGLKSAIQFRDCQKYQLTIAKMKAIPFGVTIHKTRIFITFGGIFSITSFVISFFLFLIGANHSATL